MIHSPRRRRAGVGAQQRETAAAADSKARIIAGLCLALAGPGASHAAAQLRVATWNVTLYDGGAGSLARNPDFQTALYGDFNGRSLAPDIIVGQEFINETGVLAFLDMLNSAAAGPGDWAAAPYTPVSAPGGSSNALFYRTTRVNLLGVRVISRGTGSGPGQPPRNNHRYHVRLAGYTGPGAELYLYSSHMKAGSTLADLERRTPEADRLVIDAGLLPASANYLLAGDFNIPTAFEPAYQSLVGAGTLVDPLHRPDAWNNNPTFRALHTQDPATQMDDRFDQILVAATLLDGDGIAYLPAAPGGDVAIPASLAGWSDPNHSYRAFGNDASGDGRNLPLRTIGNTMVGPTIASALVHAAAGGGHIPVYLDLQVPARIVAPEIIDFGEVALGSTPTAELAVANTADVQLWTSDGTAFGIDTLDYSLASEGPCIVPPGPFVAEPNTAGRHTVRLNASETGAVSGIITVSSDADRPLVEIQVVGTVVEPDTCLCERTGDAPSSVDVFDLLAYLDAWFASLPSADVQAPIGVDVLDLLLFLDCWFEADGSPRCS